jgi:hypothetical protein
MVPAGAPLVRLDKALVPLTTGLEDLGRSWRYRIGPADRDHADPSVIELVATAGPDALKPLAPVHVRAHRDASGVTVSWIRRTRRDGDAWEPVDVPLGEDRERYEIDILHGTARVRMLASTGTEVLYATAQELADFGTSQATLTLRIAQLSASVGRGFERSVTVPVM